MNLIDATVTSISDQVEIKYDKYFIKVTYIDMGGEGETFLMFDTLDEIKALEIGYKFLH